MDKAEIDVIDTLVLFFNFSPAIPVTLPLIVAWVRYFLGLGQWDGMPLFPIIFDFLGLFPASSFWLVFTLPI